MKTKNKEILSSCCAFGSDGTENVMVEFKDCPVGRKVGYRERTKHLSVPNDMENPIIKECTCIYRSGLHGGHMLPPCEHYEGTKKVQRNKRTKYKVLCGALDNATIR